MTELAVVRSIDKPVESVVKALEEHLAAAKRGEYIAFAIVTVYPDGATGTQFSPTYTTQQRGALAYLIHRLNESTDSQ